MHTRREFLLLMLFPSLAAPATLAAAPPNMVLILADDLGWRDLGCYGGSLAETPRLDRLASQGVRFTHAYSPAPICSASRAAIMTGRSPARLRFEFVTKPREARPPARRLRPPPYTRDLPLEEVTLGEALGKAGYVTGFFGKWHLNEHHGRYLGWSPTHGPSQQGFQIAIEQFGAHPYSGRDREPARVGLAKGVYPDDALTDLAIEFVETPRQRPFFLCLCHFFVHTPVRAPTEWLFEKYREAAALGPGGARRRAHYAAFLEMLDHQVGRLLASLERAGVAENTLVVFASDNGGHPEYASHAPLRGGKWNLYEAGVRTPLIVRWPGVTPDGVECETPVIGTDLLPTFCEAAGVEPPAAALDGQSLMPLLRGQSDSFPERELTWHFPYYHPETGYERALPSIGVDDFAVSRTTPQSALRRGRHKLLYFHEGPRVELYDLKSDPGERRDLAEARPEVAGQLTRRLLELLQSQGARFPVAAE